MSCCDDHHHHQKVVYRGQQMETFGTPYLPPLDAQSVVEDAVGQTDPHRVEATAHVVHGVFRTDLPAVAYWAFLYLDPQYPLASFDYLAVDHYCLYPILPVTAALSPYLHRVAILLTVLRVAFGRRPDLARLDLFVEVGHDRPQDDHSIPSSFVEGRRYLEGDGCASSLSEVD